MHLMKHKIEEFN